MGCRVSLANCEESPETVGNGELVSVCPVPETGCPFSLRMAGAFLLCVVSSVSVAIRNNKTTVHAHFIKVIRSPE